MRKRKSLSLKVSDPLLDVNDVLLTFGSTTKTAHRGGSRRWKAALGAERESKDGEFSKMLDQIDQFFAETLCTFDDGG